MKGKFNSWIFLIFSFYNFTSAIITKLASKNYSYLSSIKLSINFSNLNFLYIFQLGHRLFFKNDFYCFRLSYHDFVLQNFCCHFGQSRASPARGRLARASAARPLSVCWNYLFFGKIIIFKSRNFARHLWLLTSEFRYASLMDSKSKFLNSVSSYLSDFAHVSKW